MKAPNKITIHKYNIADDGDVVFAWLSKSPDCEPMNHPVEYIRKDTLIKWAENMKRICQGAELFEKAYQTMIDNLNSM